MALVVVATLPTVAAAQQTDWATFDGFEIAVSQSIVYDAARARMVLLNGTQTWESDGASWRLREGNNPMGIRSEPALAYDSTRNVTVLFSGSGLGPYQSDTWQWDGTAWSRIATAISPPGRWYGGVAYDSARQRLVLCGGESSVGRINDTWEFDGVNWTQRLPANSPSAFFRQRMAYDSARGVVVLFGGLDQSGTQVLNETWEWDGIDWRRRQPAQSPAGRWGHGMTYDSHRGRTLMFGGWDGRTSYSDAWEWDGINWTQVPTPIAPGLGLNSPVAYDPLRFETIHVERRLGGAPTWAFDGTAWRVVIPAASPSSNDLHALAYDQARGATVLFGGLLSSRLQDETWERRGGLWQRASPVTAPAARLGHGLAYDPTMRQVLLFGGSTGSLLADTWHWDGRNWLQRQPARSPPARLNHALAADTARGRVVLFGGQTGPGAWLNDTWEWDGVNWTQANPPQSPPVRANHAMAYDPVRGRTVMFGGGDYFVGPSLGDHWEWDGVGWTQVQPPQLPPTRGGHGMAFDAARGVVVMTGGYDTLVISFPSARGDVWEWDGVQWTQRLTAHNPWPRKTTRVAYDAVLRRTVQFGGDSFADTWEYGPVGGATVTETSVGCAGATGVPAVRALGPPRTGNPFFALQVSSLPAATIAALGLSAVSTTVSLPGSCQVLGAPILLPAVTNGRGSATFALAVPNVPALRGAVLYGQATGIVQGGAFLGILAFSPILRMTID